MKRFRQQICASLRPKQRILWSGALGLLLLWFLSGPAATRLQVSQQHIASGQVPDAVYLVCGARAQPARLQALFGWLASSPRLPKHILIGNDTQNSLWSRTHQRNLTRAEWAYEAIDAYLQHAGSDRQPSITPGTFANTDGEMQALARYLQDHPEIQTLALITSRFHARRTLTRFEAHAPPSVQAYLIPTQPHWRNRAPWTVLAEWLKLLRDQLALSQHPWLSRPTNP